MCQTEDGLQYDHINDDEEIKVIPTKADGAENNVKESNLMFQLMENKLEPDSQMKLLVLSTTNGGGYPDGHPSSTD